MSGVVSASYRPVTDSFTVTRNMQWERQASWTGVAPMTSWTGMAPMSSIAVAGEDTYASAHIAGERVLSGTQSARDTLHYQSLEDPHLEGHYSKKFSNIKAMSRYEKENWPGNTLYKIRVVTGGTSEAGTVTKAFLKIIGTEGKISRIHLTKQHTGAGRTGEGYFKFTPGSTHVFKARRKDIGDIKSIALEHHGFTRKEDWFVEQVEIAKVLPVARKEKVWLFKVDQRLSLDKNRRVMRIFYPHLWRIQQSGDDKTTKSDKQFLVTEKYMRPYPMLSKETDYKVEIVTGNRDGSGTDSYVSLTLFGTNGQTRQYCLNSDQKGTFKAGSKDVFRIRKANCVGEITRIRIEHDNTGKHPDWFLKEIAVKDMKNPRWEYFFNCNQWLAKEKEDGRIYRYLDAYKEYKIEVVTGDHSKAGTDSAVFLTLFGTNGKTWAIKLEDDEKDIFERGSKDIFYVKAHCLGQLRSLRIEQDDTGDNPDWFLKSIKVEDLTKPYCHYLFNCNQWLSSQKGDGKTYRELVPFRDAKYKVEIVTGNQDGSGTNANVYLTLFGTDSKTTKRCLKNDKERNFKEGKRSVFYINAEDLGEITHLRIEHDNAGENPEWFLEKIRVTHLSNPKREFIFRCYQWLSKERGNRQTYRELIPNKGDGSDYTLTVYTSEKPLAGTDASICLVVYGTTKKDQYCKSDVIHLQNNKSLFEQGNADIFDVNIGQVENPYKMRIWHDNCKPFAGWHLNRVELTNRLTNKSYVFPCERWLAKDEDDGNIVRELPVEKPNGKCLEPLVKYSVTVFTGSKPAAGTDANVFINIFGERGDTGDRHLHTSITKQTPFERGSTDEFILEAVTLKTLHKIRIGHDGTKPGNGWFLRRVIVREIGNPISEATFTCNRWLDCRQDDGKIAIEIKAEPQYGGKNARRLQEGKHTTMSEWKTCRSVESQMRPRPPVMSERRGSSSSFTSYTSYMSEKGSSLSFNASQNSDNRLTDAADCIIVRSSRALQRRKGRRDRSSDSESSDNSMSKDKSHCLSSRYSRSENESQRSDSRSAGKSQRPSSRSGDKSHRSSSRSGDESQRPDSRSGHKSQRLNKKPVNTSHKRNSRSGDGSHRCDNRPGDKPYRSRDRSYRSRSSSEERSYRRNSRSGDKSQRRRSRSGNRSHTANSSSEERIYRGNSRSGDRSYRRSSTPGDRSHTRDSRSRERSNRYDSWSGDKSQRRRSWSRDRPHARDITSGDNSYRHDSKSGDRSQRRNSRSKGKSQRRRSTSGDRSHTRDSTSRERPNRRDSRSGDGDRPHARDITSGDKSYRRDSTSDDWSHTHDSRSREWSNRYDSWSGDKSQRRRSRSGDRSHTRDSRSGDKSQRRRSRSGDRSHTRDSRSGDKSQRRRSISGDRSHRRDSRSGDKSQRRRSRSGDRSHTRDSRYGDKSQRRRSRSGDRSHTRDSRSGDKSQRRRSISADRSHTRDSRSGDKSQRRRSISADRSHTRDSRSGDKSQRRRSISGDRSHRRDSRSGDKSQRRRSISGDRSHTRDSRSGDKSQRRRSISGDRSHRRDSRSGDKSQRRRSISGDRSHTRDITSGDKSYRRDSRSGDKSPRRDSISTDTSERCYSRFAVTTRIQDDTSLDKGQPRLPESAKLYTYNIEVIGTSKKENQLPFSVWAVLKGANGGTSKIALTSDNSKTQKLNGGQRDMFTMRSEDLGVLQECLVGAVGREEDSQKREEKWYCEEITVTKKHTAEKFVFPCNDWIEVSDSINKKHARLLKAQRK